MQVRGASCVVLGVEKKAVAKLQEDRWVGFTFPFSLIVGWWLGLTLPVFSIYIDHGFAEQCERFANSTSMCSWHLQVLKSTSISWQQIYNFCNIFCMPLLPARPDGRCSRVDQAGAGGVPVPQADGGGPRHIGVHHQVRGLCEIHKGNTLIVH